MSSTGGGEHDVKRDANSSSVGLCVILRNNLNVYEGKKESWVGVESLVIVTALS